MKDKMTTARAGFPIYDITYKNARRQSEIENEIEREEPEEVSVKPPVSLTPEQVIGFYLSKIKATSDSNEKRVYSQTILWIKMLADTRKKLAALEEKVNALDRVSDDLAEQEEYPEDE